MRWLRNLLNIKGRQSPVVSAYPIVRPYFGSSTGRRKRFPSTRISHYLIPLSIMEATDKVFGKFTARNSEGYAWWTGYLNSDQQAQVCTVLCPEVKTQYGKVYLDREMMSAMHRKLIELDQILLAELHTHPPRAGGQNEVDGNNAAIYYPGFITVVVPNFGLPRFYDLRDSFVYEYSDGGNWRRLRANEIEKRFMVEESLIEIKANEHTN